MKRFHTTSYKLYQPKKVLNSDFKVKIISDLHFSYMISNEKLQSIINQIEKEKPNYILFPGDVLDTTNMIKNEDEYYRIINFLQALGNIAPYFYFTRKS